MSEPQRVEPYVWEWEEDGPTGKITRQVQIHYTRIGTTVVYTPRYPGDALPWFDSNYEFDSDQGRWEASDVVTLGSPDAPGYGLIDPDIEDDDPDGPDDDTPVLTGAEPSASHDSPSTPVGELPARDQPAHRMEGQHMITKIGDVGTHRELMAALNTIRSEVESRQEDVDNLAAWSDGMTERIHGMGEELKALNLDKYTLGNVACLGDLMGRQKSAAGGYKNATDTSVALAVTAARNAHRRHGRIQDAVDNSDVPMAKNIFYDAE